jgi:hypothetical protein
MQNAVDLSDFIVQLKLRNPYWLEEQQRKKNEVIDVAMENIYNEELQANPRFNHIPEAIKKAVAHHVKMDAKKNSKFSKMMQLFSLIQRASEVPETNKEIRQAIIDAEWKLFIAPTRGPKFITSDNPGFATANDHLSYNTKFKDDFVFFLPVSPDYCLAISDVISDNSFTKSESIKSIPRVNINSLMVLYINDKAIQRVNRILIAADDWYLSQIADRN